MFVPSPMAEAPNPELFKKICKPAKADRNLVAAKIKRGAFAIFLAGKLMPIGAEFGMHRYRHGESSAAIRDASKLQARRGLDPSPHINSAPCSERITPLPEAGRLDLRSRRESAKTESVGVREEACYRPKGSREPARMSACAIFIRKLEKAAQIRVVRGRVAGVRDRAEVFMVILRVWSSEVIPVVAANLAYQSPDEKGLCCNAAMRSLQREVNSFGGSEFS